MDFANNIEEAFAKKRVAFLLHKARDIMKEDLHSCQLIEETQPFLNQDFTAKFSRQMEDIKPLPILEDLHLPEGFSFDDCIFRFPRCQISRHVMKLLNLVHETLDEASCSKAILAERLVLASKLMIELYRDVLPTFHKHALDQFPQHSALAYTNCMYLSFQCASLGYEYLERLPSTIQNCFVTFADLIVKIRNVGIEIFLQQLRKQRDELDSILKDSGIASLQGEAQIPPRAEQGLKQILHQLNRLRNVWQDVLPSHVYSKNIGVLLNFVIGRLIDQIVKLEDIAADSATQISTLFSLFVEKAPDLFVIDHDKRSSKHDVIRFVRLWPKLKELILVLDANLKEIDDRWALGKGPLAVEFGVDEMKQLIRALFQNTDRRATVLAKIKYDS